MLEENGRETKALTVHLPTELHTRLRILVSRRETSARELVTRLIEQELREERKRLRGGRDG